MNSDVLKLAATMLGCKVRSLHGDLTEKLAEVEALASRAGGSLYSRQVIATIIQQWKHDNPGKPAYYDA